MDLYTEQRVIATLHTYGRDASMLINNPPFENKNIILIYEAMIKRQMQNKSMKIDDVLFTLKQSGKYSPELQIVALGCKTKNPYTLERLKEMCL